MQSTSLFKSGSIRARIVVVLLMLKCSPIVGTLTIPSLRFKWNNLTLSRLRLSCRFFNNPNSNHAKDHQNGRGMEEAIDGRAVSHHAREGDGAGLLRRVLRQSQGRSLQLCLLRPAALCLEHEV